jgi:hypothetical protein
MKLLMISNPVTYREMCQVIAANMEFRNKLTGESGIRMTPEQVFNYSPHGELFNIPFWFWQCIHAMGGSTYYSDRMIET